jgi:phosphoesterase RecJ-like protein
MIKVTATELAEWIRARDHFAVVAHISPDGDSICSALLLRRLLLREGKRVEVVCQDAPPDMYAFLPDIDAVLKTDDFPFVPEHVVFIDVSSVDRAGGAWKFMDVAKDSATVDHHETNTGFTDISLVDGKAAATGELIAQLFKIFEVPLELETAVLLYTSLSTDTGNFSYSNTTPGALRLAAECVEAGLKIAEINFILFHRRALARTLLLGRALKSIKLHEDGAVAFAEITRKAFQKSHARHEDNEGIVSYLTEIEGVKVAALFEERVGETKVSLRSNGEVNVGQIALALGGGGHERAAGVQLFLLVKAARKLILKALSDSLKGRFDERAEKGAY